MARPLAPVVSKSASALHVLSSQLSRSRSSVAAWGRDLLQSTSSVAGKLTLPFANIGRRIRLSFAPAGEALAPLGSAVAGLGAKIGSLIPGGMRSAVASMSSIASSGFRGLSSVFQSGLTGLKNTASSIGQVAAGAVATAFAAISAAVAANMSGAVARVDTMNNFPRVMKNLGFRDEESILSISKLDQGIQGLPTALDEIVAMVQDIAPLESSLDRTTEVALAMNNALLAGGKGAADANRAMRQYSQMLGKQDVDMQSWRTMMEVMPGQLSQLAKALLGPTANSLDLYDAMRDGNVTFEQFNDKLIELNKTGYEGFASFEKQARDATSGLATGWRNIGTAIKRNIGNAIQAIGVENILGVFDSLKSAINDVGARVVDVIGKVKDLGGGDLGKVFSSIGSSLANIAPLLGVFAPLLGHIPLIGRLFAGLTGPVGVFIGLIGSMVANSENLRSAFSGIFDKVAGEAQVFAPILSDVVNVLGEIAGVLGDALAPVVSGIGDFLAQLMPVLATLADSVLTKISETLTEISPTLTTFGESIGQILGILGSLLAPIGDVLAAIVPIFGELVQVLLPPLGDVLVMMMPLLEQIGAAIGSILEALVPVLAPIGELIGVLLPPLIGLFTAVLPPVISLASIILTSLIPVIEGLLAALGGVIEFVVGVFTGDWDRAWRGVQQMFSGFTNAVKSLIEGSLKPIFHDLPNFIRGIFSGAGSWLWNAGQSIVQGLVNGINSAFEWVRSTLSELTSLLPDWKGPAELDKVILKKSGELVISGFVSGMEGRYKSAEKSLGEFTRRLGKTPAADLPAGMIDANDVSGDWSSESRGKNPKSLQVVVYVTNPFTGEQVKQIVRGEVIEVIEEAGV